MSPKTQQSVLINSIAARISAALLVTIIHEIGHLIVALSFGNSATLYHNRVETHDENLAFI